ncbi:R2-like ligand-binding oxidase [Laceyella putida]|uniref:R2-like ligand-binding oxidase n=1 Tax=Laceyella putida TaxID=110101 RepID=A0ABW2RMD4_9BACL
MARRVVTLTKGLDTQMVPYRLYQKAKRFGVWNPEDIDLTQDIQDWQRFSDTQKMEFLSIAANFLAGEEAVTVDLLPLMTALAREGRLEEEMFLTTFLFEEAKHTEFFRLHLNALGVTEDLTRFLSNRGAPELFLYDREEHHGQESNTLSRIMNRLLTDSSPEAFADAAIVYNMLIEGVGAETGYWFFEQALERQGYMPGLMKGIRLIKKDESRHISYGTYLLHRLIQEHPPLYDYIMSRMEELNPIQEPTPQMIANYPNSFGVTLEERIHFSQKQFVIRKQIIARAKEKSLEEIYRQFGLEQL